MRRGSRLCLNKKLGRFCLSYHLQYIVSSKDFKNLEKCLCRKPSWKSTLDARDLVLRPNPATDITRWPQAAQTTVCKHSDDVQKLYLEHLQWVQSRPFCNWACTVISILFSVYYVHFLTLSKLLTMFLHFDEKSHNLSLHHCHCHASNQKQHDHTPLLKHKQQQRGKWLMTLVDFYFTT